MVKMGMDVDVDVVILLDGRKKERERMFGGEEAGLYT